MKKYRYAILRKPAFRFFSFVCLLCLLSIYFYFDQIMNTLTRHIINFAV